MDTLYRTIKSIKKAKREFVQNIINIPGWSTNKKLIIIESDDWGSIRIPSKEVYKRLLNLGIRMDCNPFTRYDSLESEEDLSLLFDVLTKYRDSRGNYPVITANCAVANPDFKKIELSEYRQFYYEPFTETMKKYPEHKNAFALWQCGIEQNIFSPQFHCREHVNVIRWLRDLQGGEKDILLAFKNGMISTGNSFTKVNKYAYMDSFNYNAKEELYTLNAVAKDGIELFSQVFGYHPKSFVAPCYIWSSELESELTKWGIEYIQGSEIQNIPRKTEGTKTLGWKRHYVGQINRYKQIYLIRNCSFEPSWNENIDWVNNCLWDIAAAFKWNKPATISTHRLNYIGYIDKSNRDKNLKLISLLLSKIIKLWPDVEFITSVELGKMIR